MKRKPKSRLLANVLWLWARWKERRLNPRCLIHFACLPITAQQQGIQFLSKEAKTDTDRKDNLNSITLGLSPTSIQHQPSHSFSWQQQDYHNIFDYLCKMLYNYFNLHNWLQVRISCHFYANVKRPRSEVSS